MGVWYVGHEKQSIVEAYPYYVSRLSIALGFKAHVALTRRPK